MLSRDIGQTKQFGATNETIYRRSLIRTNLLRFNLFNYGGRMNELVINDVVSTNLQEVADHTSGTMPYASRLLVIETKVGTFEIRLYSDEPEKLKVAI